MPRKDTHFNFNDLCNTLHALKANGNPFDALNKVDRALNDLTSYKQVAEICLILFQKYRDDTPFKTNAALYHLMAKLTRPHRNPTLQFKSFDSIFVFQRLLQEQFNSDCSLSYSYYINLFYSLIKCSYKQKFFSINIKSADELITFMEKCGYCFQDNMDHKKQTQALQNEIVTKIFSVDFLSSTIQTYEDLAKIITLIPKNHTELRRELLERHIHLIPIDYSPQSPEENSYWKNRERYLNEIKLKKEKANYYTLFPLDSLLHRSNPFDEAYSGLNLYNLFGSNAPFKGAERLIGFAFEADKKEEFLLK